LRVLTQVEREPHQLDAILDTALERGPEMDARDRRLAFALVYGVLRWRGALDWIIDQLSRTPIRKIQPELLNILRLGLFQIRFMDRIPPTAAVSTAVDLARSGVGEWATGFVNGLLRNAVRKSDVLRWPDPERDPVLSLAVRQSFPVWMIARWIERFPIGEVESLCMALNAAAPLTLRCNTLRIDRDRLIGELASLADAAPMAWSPDGIRVTGFQGHVTEIPGYAAGHFQVQDEAAQLVSRLLDPRPGERVLDACAGRGGKTGHMAQLMRGSGSILSLDNHAGRLEALNAEMRRLGVAIVETRMADLEAPPTPDLLGRFDRVLVDAPCSGLGVLRRQPEAKWAADKQDLTRHCDRQIRLLDHAARCLRPDGAMVYAVCSMEPEETDAVVQAFMQAHPEYRAASQDESARIIPAPLTTPEGFFRCFPHRHQTDGFFAARIIRQP